MLDRSRALRDQVQRHFEQSNSPMWVAVENRGEDDPDQYWVGKVLGVEKVHRERGSIGRVRYDVGDVEFVVQWYQRDISGGDERRVFRLWKQREASDETGEKADAGPVAGTVYTFNSTELRAIDIEMQRLPTIGEQAEPPPATRGAPRAAAQRARGAWRSAIQRAVHEQRGDPPEILWEISAGSERLVLDNCS